MKTRIHIRKKKSRRILMRISTTVLIIAWVFSGWPQIQFDVAGRTIAFPQKIEKAYAAALVIETADTSQDGSNATLSTLGITIPNYSEDDLVIVLINIWQNTTADTDVSWPSGPEGETLTEIETGYGGSGSFHLPMIAFAWFKGAAGGHTSANWNVTTDDATRFASAVVIVPAGEYDADTPIGASGKTFSTADSTTPGFPAFTANSDDTDGKLLAFIAVDQDLISGTPAGWTDLQNLDQGRASIVLSGRDAAVTSSESIGASTWTVAGDAYSGYGFVVRAAVVIPAPDAPTDFTTTSNTGEVALSWTAPTETGDSELETYGIFRDTTSSATTLLASIATTSTTYSDTTAVHGTIYYYRVTATNGDSATSTYSNERSSGPNSGRIVRLKGVRLR